MPLFRRYILANVLIYFCCLVVRRYFRGNFDSSVLTWDPAVCPWSQASSIVSFTSAAQNQQQYACTPNMVSCVPSCLAGYCGVSTVCTYPPPPSPPPVVAGVGGCAPADNAVECAALLGAYVAWGNQPASWAAGIAAGASYCSWDTGTITACVNGRVQQLCAARQPSRAKPGVEARRGSKSFALWCARLVKRTRSRSCPQQPLRQHAQWHHPGDSGQPGESAGSVRSPLHSQATPPGIDMRRARCALCASLTEQSCLRSCPQLPPEQPAERHHPGDAGQPGKFAESVRSPPALPGDAGRRDETSQGALCVRGGLSRRTHAPAHSYLQNNQLSGTIPATLGSLASLQVLCTARQPPSHTTPKGVEATRRARRAPCMRRAERTRSHLCPHSAALTPTSSQPGTGPSARGLASPVYNL